jgi:hypothetical protein
MTMVIDENQRRVSCRETSLAEEADNSTLTDSLMESNAPKPPRSASESKARP